MNEQIKNWRDRLAKMKFVKRQSTALLEVDDVNGEKLIFPEIGEASEITTDTVVTATDGTHVISLDNKTLTIEVLNGKVASVTEDGSQEEMNEETQQFVEAVATALLDHDTLLATAQKTIEAQAATIATMQEDFKKFKATMSHQNDEVVEKEKGVLIGGKKIDLSKINLK